ncbi:MAG: hydrolase [Candidatus Omnitrophica bacterium]|nr:hydrolase [Candidatus Omnitrophota bacterium]
MMFSVEKSVLVVVDIQGTLVRVMHDQVRLFKNIQSLIRGCRTLDIPIIVTEQAPEKIGSTAPEIMQCLGDVQPIPKDSFSCFLSQEFTSALKSYRRKEIILCGIESHVCAFQTVADLLQHKYMVNVIADAVSSRTSEDRIIGLDRMRSLGASISSTEMILTELLRTSSHPKFKEILSLIK